MEAAGSYDKEASSADLGTFSVNQEGDVVGEEVTAEDNRFRPDAESTERTANQPYTVGVTDGGKELQIKKHPKTIGFVIQFKDGGQLPMELQGIWTNEGLAKKAASVYLGRAID